MSYEPTLFDPPAAEQARDAALNKVDRATDPDWRRAVLHTIESLCKLRRTLTTDDVWQSLHHWTSTAPSEARAIGVIMLKAQAQGLIKPTSTYVPSARPEAHCRPIRVWEVVA